MSFGDSMHLYNQLWIRLCVKPHYPIGKDEKSFLKYMNSAIIFQINWKDEATTTFHNKPGNQQPNVTAKRKTGWGDTKSSSLTLVRGARPQQNPKALSTSLNIAELSATFLLHHLSSLVWFLSYSSIMLNPQPSPPSPPRQSWCGNASGSMTPAAVSPGPSLPLGLRRRACTAEHQRNMPWHKTVAKRPRALPPVRLEQPLTLTRQGQAPRHFPKPARSWGEGNWQRASSHAADEAWGEDRESWAGLGIERNSKKLFQILR